MLRALLGRALARRLAGLAFTPLWPRPAPPDCILRSSSIRRAASCRSRRCCVRPRPATASCCTSPCSRSRRAPTGVRWRCVRQAAAARCAPGGWMRRPAPSCACATAASSPPSSRRATTARCCRRCRRWPRPRAASSSSGSGWYPRPAELFAYEVDLVVPRRPAGAGRRPAGARAAPAAAGEPYRARFVFEHLADGIDLMAGPWVVRERLAAQADGRPLRLRTYFPAALDAEAGLAEAYLADSQRYIERYAGQIGAYPFTEFSVVASPAAYRLRHAHADLHRRAGAAPALHPCEFARPRGVAQLVGQRRAG